MAINSTNAATAVPKRPSDFFTEQLPGPIFLRPGGARVYEDLVGTVPVPHITLPSVSHVAEGAAATETDATITGRTLSPKTASIHTPYHSVLDYTGGVIRAAYDEAAMLSLMAEVEKMAIQGSGTGNEPTGIVHEGSLTQANSVAAATDYHAAEESILNNGLTSSQISVLLSPSMAKAARNTPAIAGGHTPIFRDGRLLGYPTVISPFVPTGKGIMGYLPAMVIGFWGDEVQVIEDRTTNPGQVRLTYMLEYDTGIGNLKAFLLLNT